MLACLIAKTAHKNLTWKREKGREKKTVDASVNRLNAAPNAQEHRFQQQGHSIHGTKELNASDPTQIK
jgi:hypothetical protein